MRRANVGEKLMIYETVLCLDLSTTSTGWSVFKLETRELLDYGILKPKVKGITKLKYPLAQLAKCQNLADQVMELEAKFNPSIIVVEEINRHKNRMSGKTLDILHGIVWDRLGDKLKLVTYMDSDGSTGWRTRLKLFMNDADRSHNKEAKKLNKKLPKDQQIHIINKKHLACRFVNAKYGTDFDVVKRKTDEDICDSIGLGHAFLHYIHPTITMV